MINYLEFFQLIQFFCHKTCGYYCWFEKDIKEIFTYKTAIINHVVVVRFFYLIYNAIFLALLAIGYKEKGLLGPISIYFGIIKTNGHDILYLLYLVWSIGAMCLLIFQL